MAQIYEIQINKRWIIRVSLYLFLHSSFFTEIHITFWYHLTNVSLAPVQLIPHCRYSAGGIITGAIYRLKLGPRASLAGAIMGGALGTLAGTINTAILYLTGQDVAMLLGIVIFCFLCFIL